MNIEEKTTEFARIAGKSSKISPKFDQIGINTEIHNHLQNMYRYSQSISEMQDFLHERFPPATCVCRYILQ